jgi:hypothetical protein
VVIDGLKSYASALRELGTFGIAACTIFVDETRRNAFGLAPYRLTCDGDDVVVPGGNRRLDAARPQVEGRLLRRKQSPVDWSTSKKIVATVATSLIAGPQPAGLS